MNHILKKLQIAGAKKQKKPKPPVYKPPEMGELQYAASYSYAETLDLISDGPIGGVVNAQGDLLDGLSILQGIYLDNTPVAVGIDTDFDRLEAAAAEQHSMGMESGADTGIKSLTNFCKALQQQTQNMISALDFQGSPGTTVMGERDDPHNQVNMMHIMFRRKSGYPSVAPISQYDAALYIRAYLKYTAAASPDDQTFHMWLDGVRLEGQDIGSGEVAFGPTNAQYRNETYPIGVRKPWSGGAGAWSTLLDRARGPRSLFWTDEETLGDSKFFASYAPILRHDQHHWGLFSEGMDAAQTFVQEELDEILDLWNNSREGENANRIQEAVARRALETLGWTEGSDITTLLKDADGPRYNMLMIAKVSGDHPDLNRKITTDRGDLLNFGILPYSSQIEGIRLGTYEFYTNFAIYYLLNSRASSFWANTTTSPNVSVRDISCPEVGPDGVLTGKMHGFLLYTFRPSGENHIWRAKKMYSYQRAFPRQVTNELSLIDNLRYTRSPTSDILEIYRRLQSGDDELQSGSLVPRTTASFFSQQEKNLKFNYTNVLAEVKKGEEDQEPFTNFRSIFIDHIYNSELFGPFRTAVSSALNWVDIAGSQKLAPQRITQNASLLTRSQVLTEDSANFNTQMLDGLPVEEGSDDRRKSGNDPVRSYSSWPKDSLGHWDEKAIPIIHTIYNPNVTSAFITLNISSLFDTLVNDVNGVRLPDGGSDTLNIGTKFPTVVNIKVETGTIGKRKNESGTNEKPFKSYTFRIVALVEGQTLIDIGNPDSRGEVTDKDFVLGLSSSDARTSLNVPFELPKVLRQEWSSFGVNDEPAVIAGEAAVGSEEKRYIKVTKLSFETNSVLISKEVALNKVTEIIETDCTYPFSAMVGTKLDSRAFSSVPERSYDCKLKLVKIPSNYFPQNINGKDRRYYKNTEEFNDAPRADKLIYEGDWDGEFHPNLRWTDNPAWILYDLLTNNRYGMGSHIDVDKINKWQLYKIGRFCDAVDDEGYFQGVEDGHGGLEPRFSCNVVFQQGQKIYDAINTIAGIFKGRVFFGNSEINFVDDRPRSPINLFTNESVKDGQFFYSNNRRDEQFNTIEVSFKDRFDNFIPKIEVVEDEEDIRERGIFKTRIEGVGITSRSMAGRVAQHKIFSSIEENQTVAFSAGLESLLCQPGDLVIIEDELKTNKANFGKVLAVDVEAETIRISNSVDATVNTGSLTVYNPTGLDTIGDVDDLLTIKRHRFEGFTITGITPTPSWARYTGAYQFSGYTAGYNVADEDTEDIRYEEYALYTGGSGTLLYFNTTATGWTFASGTGVGGRDAFALGSGDFISELTGTQELIPFNTGNLQAFDMASPYRTGPTLAFGGFSGLDSSYAGVLASEISAMSPDQMSVLSVTGHVWTSDADLELRGFNPYGTVLSGFNKPQLLPFVKLGSPAKFEIKDASPFIYKVISMKEDAPNEYLVTATKYDTGKFNLIEKNISIENKANTYSYQVAQTINGIEYSTLPPPALHSITTGEPDASNDTFTITGMWTGVENSTGYNVRLTQPNGVVVSEDVPHPTTGCEFTNLSQVGVFNFCVNSLGNKGGNGEVNAFFDSSYDCSGVFVVYDELLLFNRGFVNKIEIINI